MNQKSFCCFPNCGKDATFRILTERKTNAAFGLMAGPDPYSDDTDACKDHVGELLGWQPDAANTNEIYWTVHQFPDGLPGYTVQIPGPEEAAEIAHRFGPADGR